jgi:ATP-dependent DNA helicase RecQ
LNCGAVKIFAKGFTNLKVFESITSDEIDGIVTASRTGMVIPVLAKLPFSKEPVQNFFDKFYHAFLRDQLKLQKQIDKCLIIEAEEAELSKNQLAAIESEISEKRQYKHDLLDYLTYLLDNYKDSKKLHQEIGRYLGVPKHLLGKIHKTESGIWVRSKSEVIIANILHRSKIPFEYEQKLFYNKTQWKEPDFTITHNGKTWYWEHLGMLGEQYDSDWADKKAIYDSFKIKTLITTKESSVLSTLANEKIKIILESK